jgi:hypothetical protein
MTDSNSPGSHGGDSPGDDDAEPGLARGDARGRRVTLNVEGLTLPVGIRIEQLRLRATGVSTAAWVLVALALAVAVVSLAWLLRAT